MGILITEGALVSLRKFGGFVQQQNNNSKPFKTHKFCHSWKSGRMYPYLSDPVIRGVKTAPPQSSPQLKRSVCVLSWVLFSRQVAKGQAGLRKRGKVPQYVITTHSGETPSSCSPSTC